VTSFYFVNVIFWLYAITLMLYLWLYANALILYLWLYAHVIALMLYLWLYAIALMLYLWLCACYFANIIFVTLCYCANIICVALCYCAVIFVIAFDIRDTSNTMNTVLFIITCAVRPSSLHLSYYNTRQMLHLSPVWLCIYLSQFYLLYIAPYKLK